MSDNSISIVPRVSSYPNHEAKAQEILDWLIEKEIVEPVLSSCALGTNLGYAMAKWASQAVVDPQRLPVNLGVNGLEIILERTVFDAGSNDLDEIICPSCHSNVVDDDWDLNAWAEHESDVLECPRCKTKSEINQYQFEPNWGFSNLGFRFWNWPGLSTEFISAFRRRLNADIQVVHQLI